MNDRTRAETLKNGEPKAEANTNFIFQIQTEFDSMSKSFKKIAKYIIGHPNKTLEMSITMLAQKIGTSASTITRFCQALGYSGYPQFKFNFDRSSVSSIDAKQILAQGDPSSIIKEKLRLLYRRAMEETLDKLDDATVEKIADLVAAAEKVFFFGQFGNGVSARLGEALFMQAGIIAVAYTDISLASVAAAQMKTNDIAIGLSSSGRAKTPIDALRVARSAGVTTVGITGFANSPLAEQSDILICYNLGLEDVRLVHIDRLCETIVLGIIQNNIISKNYARMEKTLKVSKNAFLSARYIDSK